MKVSNGKEILGLIHLAIRTPQSYRLLVICAPFISDRFLRPLVASNKTVNIPTIVITSPSTAHQLSIKSKNWKGPLIIGTIPNLHAKVYLACGQDDRDSVAIIGSFNLTMAALNDNLEIGVRFTGNTSELRQVINLLELELLRMANINTYGEKL